MRLLLRYFRTALRLGRMPSLLGSEVHRSTFAARPHNALEDAVVFVCDVERCLESLSAFDRTLIACCVLENRSEWEAARYFRRTQPEVSRLLGSLLDRLYSTFCRKRMLAPPRDLGARRSGAGQPASKNPIKEVP
jgi:hypothetical protein